MSTRTLVELNHDHCPSDDRLEYWAREIRDYMRSGDKSALPPGVTFKHMRHHSDPDPIIDLPQRITELEISNCDAGRIINEINWQLADSERAKEAVEHKLAAAREAWEAIKPLIGDSTFNRKGSLGSKLDKALAQINAVRQPAEPEGR